MHLQNVLFKGFLVMLLLGWFFFTTTGKLEIQAISVIFSTENKMQWLKAN